MTQRHVPASAAIVLLLMFSAAGSAETSTDNWWRVVQLRTGDGVEVQPFNGKKSKGVIVSVSDTQMILTAQGRGIVLSRSTVKRVRVKTRLGRIRNGLVGAGIGGGGAAAGVLLFSSKYGDGPLPASLIGRVIALGSAIGFATGTIGPGYQTIFTAK